MSLSAAVIMPALPWVAGNSSPYVDFFRWLLGEITHAQSFKFPNVLLQYPANMPDNVCTHFFLESGAMGLANRNDGIKVIETCHVLLAVGSSIP